MKYQSLLLGNKLFECRFVTSSQIVRQKLCDINASLDLTYKMKNNQDIYYKNKSTKCFLKIKLLANNIINQYF